MNLPERVIDAERAGGTGNAAPKRAVGADSVGLDEAMACVDDIEWRHVRTRSHQVMIALRDGVHELRGEVYAACSDLARIRAALSDVISCAHGDGTMCTRDAYGCCCVIRLRMVEAGVSPAPPRAAEAEDGA